MQQCNSSDLQSHQIHSWRTAAQCPGDLRYDLQANRLELLAAEEPLCVQS